MTETEEESEEEKILIVNQKKKLINSMGLGFPVHLNLSYSKNNHRVRNGGENWSVKIKFVKTSSFLFNQVNTVFLP